MAGLPPTAGAAVTSVAEAVARMEAIAAALPPDDGLACFNRMYLEVTRQVYLKIGAGYFDDPEFMTLLDVIFANLYFAAADVAETPALAPPAWRPLLNRRALPGIEPIQYALAGMNAHISHDLPVAVVATCIALGTAPEAGSHRADYEKVDRLLDAAEQAIRQSFENAAERSADQHLLAVVNLISSWTINSARDVAWNNSLLLWALRDDPAARDLFDATLAATTASASRLLLVAV